MDNKKIILNIVKLIFALIIGGVMGAKLLTSGSEILIIAFFCVMCDRWNYTVMY